MDLPDAVINVKSQHCGLIFSHHIMSNRPFFEFLPQLNLI